MGWNESDVYHKPKAFGLTRVGLLDLVAAARKAVTT